MMAHPGKKLNHGNEIPQMIEWNEERELDWFYSNILFMMRLIAM